MFLKTIKFRVANFFYNSCLNQETFFIDLNKIDFLINRLIKKIKQDYDFPIKVKGSNHLVFKLKSCNSHYTLEVSNHQKIISCIYLETKNLENYLIKNKKLLQEEILKNFIDSSNN